MVRKYHVIGSRNPRRMLLSSLDSPGLHDNWLWGRSFKSRPIEPIEVGIVSGYEMSELLDYFGTPPIISQKFYDFLVASGVDNLEVFDVVLTSEDRSIQYRGFKAMNVVGMVRAAGDGTEYSGTNRSRLLDASIERLVIDQEAAQDLLLFRLAEYSGAIVVHDDLMRAIEKGGFPSITFLEPEGFIS